MEEVLVSLDTTPKVKSWLSQPITAPYNFVGIKTQLRKKRDLTRKEMTNLEHQKPSQNGGLSEIPVVSD